MKTPKRNCQEDQIHDTNPSCETRRYKRTQRDNRSSTSRNLCTTTLDDTDGDNSLRCCCAYINSDPTYRPRPIMKPYP